MGPKNLTPFLIMLVKVVKSQNYYHLEVTLQALYEEGYKLEGMRSGVGKETIAVLVKE